MPIGKPGEKSVQGAQCCRRRLTGVEVTYETYQLGEALIAPSGVTSHRSRQASVPSFPHHSLRVDDEVVCNVVPALIGAGVEVEPTPQDPGHVGRGVAIARRRVMNQEEFHVLGGKWAFGRMLRAPQGPRVDGDSPHRQCQGVGCHREASSRAEELSTGEQSHVSDKLGVTRR